MHFELLDWMYSLRALLLLAAFAGFAWALVSARRQTAQNNAQLCARLETALGEIRKLSGQVTELGGTLESLGTRLAQADAQRRQCRGNRRELRHHARRGQAAAATARVRRSP